jgi:glucokinase
MLLAGDIGGTKTGLAIVTAESGPRQPLIQASYPSADYASLEELLQEFLAHASSSRESSLEPERTCFGIAGPVIEGRVTATNLPWEIDARQLQEAFGLSQVDLLNDLEAIAYSIPRLAADDLMTLNAGKPAPLGAMAVIAPGTGLGEAYLTWHGDRYDAHPSEGGHCDLAPRTDLQRRLLAYLQERYGHVSYERVCSGVGLPNIYTFLREEGVAAQGGLTEAAGELDAEIQAAADPTPVIVNAALAGRPGSELCVAALDMMVEILGAEAGNLALKILATGGIYLGGGMPPRMLPALRGPRFLQAFVGKGRLGYVLERIPVHVILNSDAGLVGAAAYGLDQAT